MSSVYYEYLKDMIDSFYENEYIEEKFDQAIVSEQKSVFEDLKETSDQLTTVVEKDIPDTISKLKKVDQKLKVKFKHDYKAALKKLDKEIPDMLNDISKYNKGTKFGKGSFAVANVIAFTVPVCYLIPCSGEMMFTVAEVVNFLLEYKRRWNGSNRSAINDFVNKCENRYDEITTNTIQEEKAARSIKKLLLMFLKNAKALIEDALIILEGGIVSNADKVYKKTKKIGDSIDKHTDNSENKIVKKANDFGKKLSTVSGELDKDAKKAIKSQKKYISKKKELKQMKKEMKTVSESVKDLMITIYEKEMNGDINADERALLIDKLNLL